jgi:four helix bundle protein
LRRSAVSIPANIAEGFEYDNRKEFKRFLTYSKGSGGELRSHLSVLHKVGYVSEETCLAMQSRLKVQARKTSKLIKYLNDSAKKP